MSSPEVKPITFQLLNKITDNFSKEKRVGSGGYGEVYKGVLNGDEIAVKKLFLVNGLDDEAFKNEFFNLMKVKHVNIIRLIGYCYEITHQHTEYKGSLALAQVIERALCFEYMQRGSLAKHISDESCICDWPTTYKIIKGTCEGLHYLHKGRGEANFIYHLDLKPENILLDKNMVPKVGDFGLSRLFSTSKTHQTSNRTGTIGFMPPEFIDSGTVTPKNDVFSLGVVIFYIMAGQNGYDDYCASRSLRPEFIERVQEYWKKKMQALPGCTWHEVDLLGVKTCIEIALECVETDRDKRPTTMDIVDSLCKLDAQIEEMTKKDSKSLVVQSLVTPSKIAGWGPLYVVMVYAFDCTTSTPAWYTMNGVYWLVHEKLTHLVNSCLGYIYVMSASNTYKSDMKLVDSAETESTGYSVSSSWQTTPCTKNMASGLYGAHELIGNSNGVILLFSDGLINKGDFFNGTEEFVPKVPVHTFTLGNDNAYNHGLRAIAQRSPGGTFNLDPVPEKAQLSTHFSQLLDTILSSTVNYYEKRPCLNSGTGRRPLGVFIVYAFDCTTSTPAWYKTNDVYWLVNKKLTHGVDRIGFVYSMSTPNTYMSDMKFVDSAETGANYKRSLAGRETTCDKNMASGLYEAERLTRDHVNQNSVVLLFSDGLINKGDFFDGAEGFASKVPVHTFTLYGDAYNHGLRAIAANSPGGTFNLLPVPDNPKMSAPFSQLLDDIISGHHN